MTGPTLTGRVLLAYLAGDEGQQDQAGEAIRAALRSTASLEDAARSLGIHERSLRRWFVKLPALAAGVTLRTPGNPALKKPA